MENKEEVINKLIKEHEEYFLKENGYVMNSKQKKVLKKKLTQMVEKAMRKSNDLSII